MPANPMKILFSIAILSVAVILFACSEEIKKEEKQILTDYSDKGLPGKHRMQAYDNDQIIKLNDKDFHSFLSRTPNDSLPYVTSITGDICVDNRISLRITRGNELIFNKVFTKYSFESLVSSEFLEKAVLEGMVYDKNSPEGLVYAVSLSYPQTDLCMPISVTVSAYGKITMKIEEMPEEVYGGDEYL